MKECNESYKVICKKCKTEFLMWDFGHVYSDMIQCEYCSGEVLFSDAGYQEVCETIIFVYGTLKRGFDNESYLKNATFIDRAITVDKYPMILQNPSFPYLINDKGNGHQIKGEVYSIDDEIILKIDELEGTPEHYYREYIDVRLQNGDSIKVETYFCTECKGYEKYEMISEFGNWLDED